MAESAWSRELQFAVRPESSASLIARGISRTTLRSRAWRRARRGFYVPADAGRLPDTRRLSAAQRILDVTPALAGQAALGSWAAAYVLGVDWMDGRNPHTMTELPVDIIAADLRRQQPKGIRYQFTEVPDDQTLVRDGIPVTAPCRTTFDGARWAEGLEDAVIFVDAAARFLDLDLKELRAYVCEHAHWTGFGQALDAVELASPDVKSTWETRLRLCWLLEAQLPMPMINAPIFDRSEEFLGIADLFDPESGLVAEFDGDQHRDPVQHRADNIREEKFESANLVVVRSDKVDIRRARRQLVARLQDGYHRGQVRDRRRDNWTLDQPDWWIRREARILKV